MKMRRTRFTSESIFRIIIRKHYAALFYCMIPKLILSKPTITNKVIKLCICMLIF
ncbi:hypothetical protein BX661DRAFT_189426 [Kickxella alabastrina]|uniref:uncharacterized protein n=1 Tax=Kickxella alabastrina TaxID=61397 RepID=UPI00221EB47C|nr:uncharacterized protein BX661DRAFT_189426 [Kickxella alabastrina]KAI7820200.1 hypothetical protein BX661DRAFT_189426 [Kickxella alabastrina]